jgi:hypothetical protein
MGGGRWGEKAVIPPFFFVCHGHSLTEGTAIGVQADAFLSFGGLKQVVKHIYVSFCFSK